MVDDATVEIGEGRHAGFLASPSRVVAAAHCLGEERAGVTVRFRDGTTVGGRVVTLRPDLDVAVVAVPPSHGHAPLPLASAGGDLAPGATVAHEGHPQGFPFAFTLGRYLGTIARAGGALLRFATWAVPGDSGGPVVCADGRVHGVLVQARTDGQEGYAVPIERVRPLLSLSPPPASSPSKAPRHALAKPRIVLYGADWCAACRSAASWLRERKLPFDERDADELPAVAAERHLRIGPSIPVILVEGRRGLRVLQGFMPAELERAIKEVD
jgi:hypothetical protein